MKLKNNLWNIAASCGFADVLAKKLLVDYEGRELELAEVKVLLPNRRACKTLADAFVRFKGMTPTLLPQMQPIGDVDEEEILLQDCGTAEALNLPPVIDEVERLLLFVKIILARPADFGAEKMTLEQACFLAQELGRLIDLSYAQNLDFSGLQNLVPEEYAAHWQETLKFLEIITAYWPQILQERGVCDAAYRRNLLLEKQAEIWERVQPNKKIIIAGTTAGFVAMKKLVRSVLSLPQGEVYLSGLDRFIDDEDWAAIDEGHPQFELKELLDFLEFNRADVQDLCEIENLQREKLVAQTMLPASKTDKWRQVATQGIGIEAVEHLHLVECEEVRQEALAIALKMREVLETPEKTAALVTTDRNLARRVATQLHRWGIDVDDSGGRPLAATPWGMFMRLVLEAGKPDASRVAVLALLKNPLTGLGQSYAEIRSRARMLEQVVWRKEKDNPELEQLLEELSLTMVELSELYAQPLVSLKEMLLAHLRVAEALATTKEKEGQQVLWCGDAGNCGARLLAQWLEKADVLGDIVPQEYDGLFAAILAGNMVRAKYGTHPRLSILGPIEARLNRYDMIIIGEVNEGVFPQLPSSDPWMSRPMKKEFGFPLPEKSIGILAFDFSQLLCGKQVYLTRAARVQGTPMIPSRWLMRLQTVLGALGIEPDSIVDRKLAKWVRMVENPTEEEMRLSVPVKPMPKPKLDARPRKLSASGIELLMRDPYSVFAKYILKLYPLEDIEREQSMADYGDLIHGILEKFNRKYPQDLPANAKEELLALGRQEFENNNLAKEKAVFWLPKFEAAVEHFIALEEDYRSAIRLVHNEVEGQTEIETDLGVFTVTAKADRVDETKDGGISIIDYKTGRARSVKEVEAGFAPQLPIEALIAEAGGFRGIGPAEVRSLIYWQLGKKDVVIDKNMRDLVAKTRERLIALISKFDKLETPYDCNPTIGINQDYSDYAHLARLKEWSSNGD